MQSMKNRWPGSVQGIYDDGRQEGLDKEVGTQLKITIHEKKERQVSKDKGDGRRMSIDDTIER